MPAVLLVNYMLPAQEACTHEQTTNSANFYAADSLLLLPQALWLRFLTLPPLP